MENIKPHINNLINNYEKERQKNITTSNTNATILINNIRENLEDILQDNLDGIVILKKHGTTNLRKNPWISFLNKKLAKSGNEGIYVTIDFKTNNSKDKKNSGSHTPLGNIRISLARGRKEYDEKIKNNHEYANDFNKESHRLGTGFCSQLKESLNFIIPNVENDQSNRFRIAYKNYSASNLNTKELIKDFKALLEVYNTIAEWSDKNGEPTVNNKEFSDQKILSWVKQRTGQAYFKKALIEAHQGTCHITGCQIQDLLDAAHIKPHSEETDYSPDNGLLLRTDIHRLYDRNLLGIKPDGTVELKSILQESEYWKYHKSKIEHKPNKKLMNNLMERYNQFKKAD